MFIIINIISCKNESDSKYDAFAGSELGLFLTGRGLQRRNISFLINIKIFNYIPIYSDVINTRINKKTICIKSINTNIIWKITKSNNRIFKRKQNWIW